MKNPVIYVIGITLMVGMICAVLSFAPAIFIQSMFLEVDQKCAEQIRQEQATYGEVRTNCAQDLQSTPWWFPAIIISGGGLAGLVGGFVYSLNNVRHPEQFAPRRYSATPGP